jgi:hypothetical protein
MTGLARQLQHYLEDLDYSTKGMNHTEKSELMGYP